VITWFVHIPPCYVIHRHSSNNKYNSNNNNNNNCTPRTYCQGLWMLTLHCLQYINPATSLKFQIPRTYNPMVAHAQTHDDTLHSTITYTKYHGNIFYPKMICQSPDYTRSHGDITKYTIPWRHTVSIIAHSIPWWQIRNPWHIYNNHSFLSSVLRDISPAWCTDCILS